MDASAQEPDSDYFCLLEGMLSAGLEDDASLLQLYLYLWVERCLDFFLFRI